jgi:hypothetical protein
MWMFPNFSVKDMLLDFIKEAVRKRLAPVIPTRRLLER